MTPDSGSPVRYETRDINARALAWIALGGCLGAALALCGVGALFHIYRLQEERMGSQPALRVTESSQPPPPRLEVDMAADLKAFRKTEQDRLNGYGWIDRKAETVRIPIDRAIDRIIEHGIPDWQSKQTPERDNKVNAPEGKP